jgi:hypothetical protein
MVGAAFARVLVKQGKQEQARLLLRQQAKLHPNSLPLTLSLGTVMAQLGLSTAGRVLQKAVALDPAPGSAAVAALASYEARRQQGDDGMPIAE